VISSRAVATAARAQAKSFAAPGLPRGHDITRAALGAGQGTRCVRPPARDERRRAPSPPLR
jgi:hypothetical protein